MLDRLSPKPGARQARKRVGRGPGSGKGKTCGSGVKGQGTRSGGSTPAWFEGGQMPLTQRVPKRGFTNIFKKQWIEVRLSTLEANFASGDDVTPEVLHERGLIKKAKHDLVILGNGDGSFGVDTNRNWEWEWNTASSNTSSNTYRGPAPLSEPETQALNTWVLSRGSDLIGMLNYHTSGTRIMHNWAYTYDLPSNADVMGPLTRDMAMAIEAPTGWSKCIPALASIITATIGYHDSPTPAMPSMPSAVVYDSLSVPKNSTVRCCCQTRPAGLKY